MEQHGVNPGDVTPSQCQSREGVGHDVDDPWPTWAEALNPLPLDILLHALLRNRGLSHDSLARLLRAASATHSLRRFDVVRWERGAEVPNSYWLGWLAVVLHTPLVVLQAAQLTSLQVAPARYLASVVIDHIEATVQDIAQGWRTERRHQPEHVLNDDDVDHLRRLYRDAVLTTTREPHQTSE